MCHLMQLVNCNMLDKGQFGFCSALGMGFKFLQQILFIWTPMEFSKMAKAFMWTQWAWQFLFELMKDFPFGSLSTTAIARFFAALSLCAWTSLTHNNWTLKSNSWICVHSDSRQCSTSGLQLVGLIVSAIFLKRLMQPHLRMPALAKSVSKPLPKWTFAPILPANQLTDFHPNISATFDWTLVA